MTELFKNVDPEPSGTFAPALPPHQPFGPTPRRTFAVSASLPNREERALLAEARRAAVSVLADRLLGADLVDADFADLVADADLSTEGGGNGEGPNIDDDDVDFLRDNDALPLGVNVKEEAQEWNEEDPDDGTPRLRIRVLLRHFAPLTFEDVRKEVATRKRGSRSSSKKRGGKGATKSKAGTPTKAKNKRGRSRKRSEEGDEEDEEDSPAKKRRGRSAKARAASAEKVDRQRVRDAYFDEMMEELRKFHSDHGHCNVPQKHSKLGSWVNTIRKNYTMLRDEQDGTRRRSEIGEGGDKEGVTNTETAVSSEGTPNKRRKPKSSLTAERIQRLNDLGFKFSMRRAHRNYTWEERFEQLCETKDELRLGIRFQVEDVPHEDLEGSELGNRSRHDLRSWLEKQAEMHKRILDGKPVKNYDPDRLRRLAELGVAFPEASKQDMHWERRFGELLQYREEHGNCLVPQAHPGGLGDWVLNQRRKFGAVVKAAEERLGEGVGSESLLLAASDDRITRLREAGFVFSVRNRRWHKKPETFWEGGQNPPQFNSNQFASTQQFNTNQFNSGQQFTQAQPYNAGQQFTQPPQFNTGQQYTQAQFNPHP